MASVIILCSYGGELVCENDRYTYRGGESKPTAVGVDIPYEQLLLKMYKIVKSRPKDYDIRLRVLYPCRNESVPPAVIEDDEDVRMFLTAQLKHPDHYISLFIETMQRVNEAVLEDPVDYSGFEYDAPAVGSLGEEHILNHEYKCSPSQIPLSNTPVPELAHTSNFMTSQVRVSADVNLRSEYMASPSFTRVDLPSTSNIGNGETVLVEEGYFLNMEASEGRETERMAKSGLQSAAESLTYFLRQKDFYLSHVDVWVMSLRNKIKALLKDVDGMRGCNESVQLIEVANNTKNVIDSFIFKIAEQRGETSAGGMSYQSTFNSGIKDKPEIEDLGKKIFDLKTRLDEILSNRSQYGIHSIQPSGEASTSSNQSHLQREQRVPIVNEAEVVGFENEARTLEEWWLHQSEEDTMSVIFALSYHDMPNYLESCFLYFGALHGNSKISVRKLIRMWVAEGFVQRRGEEEMEEDVAEDYVKELIDRSMIQVEEWKSNGMAKKCRIHDLLRDRAISKAKDDRFLEVYGNEVPTSPIMADRLAITSGDISNCISLNSSTPHLLSLLDFSYESGLPEKLTLKIQGGAFKFLRVMNLQSKELSSLPDEIGDLIHLRYLRLEMPELRYLPSTITRLSNLQTLDIRHSIWLKLLLDDIVKMEQIRHLMVDNGRFSNGMQLRHLSNLRTLSSIEAGSWIEDGLEKLTNLRDLQIYKIRGDVHMALSRSISKLVHLRSLSLIAQYESWVLAFESFSKHKHLYKMKLYGRLEKLPDPHVFPPNLTELFLVGSKLDRDPMVTLEKLPNLRSLFIYNISLSADAYMGKEMVCSAGGFPLLDTLSIVGLDPLEEWRIEEGAMRNLRCLEISSCGRLKIIPDGLRYLITLQELKFGYPSEEMKERVRENEGEDWYKIRHIPSLIIE